LHSIDCRPLCADTQRASFTCGDAEIDKWFRNAALKHHEARKHLVTCARFLESERVVGFYALSAVVEDVRKLPKASISFFSFGSDRYFPCIQLVYLAVETALQRDKLGKTIMGYALRDFAEIGQRIGMPAMILTPLNSDAARFYHDLGFLPYEGGTRMFLPLKSVLSGLSAIAQEDLAAEAEEQPSLLPTEDAQPKPAAD
jgi:GNAT superfamily N-acetyltransferase